MINEKNIIISLLILIGLTLMWLPGNERSIYWRVLEFEMRHFPIIKEGKCRNIQRLLYNSPEANISTEFLAEDYPNILDLDASLSLEPNRSYHWSEYRLDRIVRTPRGYFIAKIFERGAIDPRTRKMEILHQVVYRKNSAGEYVKLERCLKALG